MILCAIDQFHRYSHLHPMFPAVEAFLAGTDLASLPEGRTDFQGDALYASVSPAARKRPNAPLEAHRAYIDVQLVLEGEDRMGWAPLAACREVEPYDPARDIVFFREKPEAYVTVRPGRLAVFFPEDAHAPLEGEDGTAHKVVLKVRAARA